jgi:hypothetical protein
MHGARWLLLPIIAGLAGVVSISVANAGKKTDEPTPALTTNSSGVVNGGIAALGTIRKQNPNPLNPNLGEIWCKLQGSSTGVMVWCGMTDPAGVSIECSTSDEHIVKALGAMNSDSLLQFAQYGSGHSDPEECKSVTVTNGSAYWPKTPF